MKNYQTIFWKITEQFLKITKQFLDWLLISNQSTLFEWVMKKVIDTFLIQQIIKSFDTF